MVGMKPRRPRRETTSIRSSGEKHLEGDDDEHRRSSARVRSNCLWEKMRKQFEDLKNHVSESCRKAEDQVAKGQLTEDMRDALFRAVQGCVPELCCDSNGCFLFQRVLDLLWVEQQIKLVGELQGKVSEAVASAHGNHVIQKCIELMQPSAVHFILHELQRVFLPSELAKDRFGCRVFQRMIEHFDPRDLDVFVDGVVEKAEELCFDQFGNFVIQHVIEHGSIEHKQNSHIRHAAC